MRKNHISGKLKRILAVACAAAMVVTSVPANTAFATESTGSDLTNETAPAEEPTNENQKTDEGTDTPAGDNNTDTTNTENSGEGESTEQGGEGGQTTDNTEDKTTDDNQDKTTDGNQDKTTDGNQDKTTDGNQDKSTNDDQNQTKKDDPQKSGDNSGNTSADGDKKTAEEETTEENKDEEEYTASISVTPDSDVYVGDKISFAVDVKDGDDQAVSDFDVEWKINGVKEVKSTSSFETTAVAPGDYTAEATIKIDDEVVATAKKDYSILGYKIDFTYDGYDDDNFGVLEYGDTLKISVVIRDNDGKPVTVDNDKIEWIIRKPDGSEEVKSDVGTVLTFKASDKASEAGRYGFQANYKDGDTLLAGGGSVFTVLRTYTVVYHNGADESFKDDQYVDDDFNDKTDDHKLKAFSDTGLSQKEGYTFIGWSTKESLDDDGCELYHNNDGKWYTKDGKEFTGFGVLEDNTVNFYAQWLDTKDPDITITLDSSKIHFSKDGVEYTQADITISDQATGIGKIYYEVVPLGKNPDEYSEWQTVDFKTVDNKAEFSFTVPVPSKGVLYVRAEDKAEKTCKDLTKNTLEIVDGPNNNTKEACALVIEDVKPDVTVSADTDDNKINSVTITATDKPEEEYSGIQSIKYVVKGYKWSKKDEKEAESVLKEETIENSVPTTLGEVANLNNITPKIDLNINYKDYTRVVIEVTATDFCGNGAPEEFPLTEDKTPPTIKINLENDGGKSQDGKNYINQDGDKLNISLEDQGSDIKTGKLQIVKDEAEETVYECNLDNGDNSVPLDAKVLEDGSYTAIVTATDGNNNDSEPEKFSFIVDRTAPIARVTYTLNPNDSARGYYYEADKKDEKNDIGTVYLNGTISVDIQASDASFDSEGIKATISKPNSEEEVVIGKDGYNAEFGSEGSNNCIIYGFDLAGNPVTVVEHFESDVYLPESDSKTRITDWTKTGNDTLEFALYGCRFVVDTAAPEAKIVYTFGQDGGNYLYSTDIDQDVDEFDFSAGTVYTHAQPVVEITVEEENIASEGVNSITIQENSNEVVIKEKGSTSYKINKEAAYFYKVFGKDKAGNVIIVHEELAKGSKVVDSKNKEFSLNSVKQEAEDAKSFIAQIRVVYDKTPPKADIEYSLNGSNGYIYRDETDDKNYTKGTVYSNCDPVINVTITEKNIPAGENLKDEANKLSMTKFFNGKEDTESKEFLSKEGLFTRKNNKDDGKYYWKVFGTDKAGNELKVTESFGKEPSIKDNGGTDQTKEDLDTSTEKVGDSEKAKLSYCIVRDTVAPVAVFNANTPSSAGGIVKSGVWKAYFNKSGNSIGTPTFTIDETNYDNGKIKAGYLYDNAKGKTYSSVTIDEWKSQNTGSFTNSGKKYSIEGNSLNDGVYRFTITGADKAGNRVEAGSSEKINELVQEGSGQLWTSYKVIDTVAPKLTLAVGQAKNNNSVANVFYKVNQDSLLVYSPFRKVRHAYGRIATTDKSGTRVGYKVDSTYNDSDINIPVSEQGFADYKAESFATEEAEQIFRVLNVVVQDRAGNTRRLAESGREDFLYLDVTRPTNDDIKPRVSVTRKSTPAITRMMGQNGQSVDLYNKSVTLGLNVFDPDKYNSSSGLKQIRVYTTMDGSNVSGSSYTFDVNFKGDKGDKKGVKPSELTYQWTKDIAFPEGSFQSNNILIRVEAVDNSGNVAATKEYNFGIDTIGPKVAVYFDNNDAQNGKYFKADRTARIEFIDRNIDWDMISISTQGNVSGGSMSSGGGNGGDDVWTKTASYTVDGDYTLNITGTDALGNAFVGSVDYTGGGRNVAPTEFTIDKTAPVITVSFDNNDVQNGKYYKNARTATVTVREHNFNASEVKIAQTADIQQGSVSAPGVGGFGGGGDDHSASINYGEDGNYTLTVNYTDLAGNPAQEVRVDEFVIDQTPPTLKFVMPDETKGASQIFAGDIAPQIDFGDINMTRGMASISLTGMKANSNALNLIEDSFENFQGTVRYENLKKVRESDDIYTATAVVTDLAGNTVEKTITFSVNRFGSTYDYNKDEYTTNLVNGYYTNDPKDVVLREINVNQLKEHKLTLYKDGDNRSLKEGTDYSFEEKVVNGHYEYIYTVFAKNFEEEGNYNIIATSKDKANNTNSNSTVKGDDGSNEVPLRFAVDKTAPTNTLTGVDLTKNKFTEDHITIYIEPRDNMNAVASFIVRVTDRNGNIIQEFEISGKELAEFFEQNKGIYTLTIDQNNQWQRVEVITTDAAGNVSTDRRIEQNTQYEVLVTPNLFYQYINRLPLVGGSAAAVAGLLFFLFAKRRKKDEEEETAA